MPSKPPGCRSSYASALDEKRRFHGKRRFPRDTAWAMSEENVEIVRRMIDRFNRDGFLPEDLFDLDVEVFNIRESPLPGPYHGYDGLREWRNGVFDVVEEGRFEVGNFQDVDEADLVIYRIRLLVALGIVAWRSISPGPTCNGFVRVGSTAPTPLQTARKPSQPPGCRSSQVRTGAPTTTRCVPRPASRSVRRSRAPSPSAVAPLTDR